MSELRSCHSPAGGAQGAGVPDGGGLAGVGSAAGLPTEGGVAAADAVANRYSADRQLRRDVPARASGTEAGMVGNSGTVAVRETANMPDELREFATSLVEVARTGFSANTPSGEQLRAALAPAAPAPQGFANPLVEQLDLTSIREEHTDALMRATSSIAPPPGLEHSLELSRLLMGLVWMRAFASELESVDLPVEQRYEAAASWVCTNFNRLIWWDCHG